MDADFGSRNEELAQAFVDASKTLEDLRKSLTSEELVKYYLQQPEAALETIFGSERTTLASAIAQEVDAIRNAPDAPAVKLALASGEGIILMIRLLSVLEFLARGLFTQRDDLIRLELLKEAGLGPLLTDKEKEIISMLTRNYDDMAKSDQRGNPPGRRRSLHPSSVRSRGRLIDHF